MSVKDIRSDLLVTIALAAAVSANGTTNGGEIDTQGKQLGLMLTPAISDFTDGVYDFTIEESDDLAFTTPVSILEGSDKLIGTLAGLQLTAESADLDVLPSIGLISTKRFVRINVVASGVTTGAFVTVTATQDAELKPVA